MARHSPKNIGRKIRRLREERGLTGDGLAQKIGTDKGTVSRIERGEAGLSVERLQRIAEALGVAPGDLLVDDAKRPAA